MSLEAFRKFVIPEFPWLGIVRDAKGAYKFSFINQLILYISSDVLCFIGSTRKRGKER